MNDQDFREKVIDELSEIRCTLRSSNDERKVIREEIKSIQEFINKAKGGWIAMASISAAVSAATAYIVNITKIIKP